MSNLINSRDLTFMLYELLDTEALLQRPRYSAHSREIFDATLDAARQIAEDLLAPHNAKGDASEPQFDGQKVQLIPETKAAWDAIANAGFLAAHWNEDEGGLQLPDVVLRAANGYFSAANAGTATYSWLTVGATNLLRSFGTTELKARYQAALGDGRSAATMALTEPGQGSALGDIKTYAEPQDDGTFRVFGSKMFISGGEHDLSDNIVHMVLARIKGAPAGVKGISLFLVPKFLVSDDGSLGARNDVALAGLLHKMGWRNTTSTVLSFGEQGGATGYLLGEAGMGLAHMFQLMNEARINIGLGAAAIAYRGYLLSLDYARERPQGRLPSSKDPLAPQVRLVQHADVRRLLLAQKAYAEGAMAMSLYAASLFEDQHSHPDADARHEAELLLDILTPVVKSWPSTYGCVSNDMAIQILGGSGYTRDYLLEQLYRDQRLNPIHEGAEAIHALDLLGRKVVMQSGAAYQLFRKAVNSTLAQAEGVSELAALTAGFAKPLARLDDVTRLLVELQKIDPDRALANANLYLDAFGRITAAWIWLKQALAAQRGLNEINSHDHAFYRGKLHAARYYIKRELPLTAPQLELLAGLEDTPLSMQDAWF